MISVTGGRRGGRLVGFTLPKVTVEGLRTMAIQFAQGQQHSDWPGERQKYPRSVNYFVTAALNDFFKKLGFEQFCVEEKSSLEKHRVRRFVAPGTEKNWRLKIRLSC